METSPPTSPFKKPSKEFFRFKNEETKEAIDRAVSECEGVIKESVPKYLELSYFKKQGELLVEATHLVDDFRKKHKLSLSETKGLFDVALLDVMLKDFKWGDKVKEEMLREKP